MTPTALDCLRGKFSPHFPKFVSLNLRVCSNVGGTTLVVTLLACDELEMHWRRGVGSSNNNKKKKKK